MTLFKQLFQFNEDAKKRMEDEQNMESRCIIAGNFAKHGIRFLNDYDECRFYQLKRNLCDTVYEDFNSHMEDNGYYVIDISHNGIVHYSKFA